MEWFADRPRWMAIVVASMLALASLGCRTYTGAPSASIISKDSTNAVYEPIGRPIERKACNWLALLAAGGEVTTHEAIIDQALEESGGDVLMDATLENWTLYLYLFARECVIVRGQPARLTQGGES